MICQHIRQNAYELQSKGYRLVHVSGYAVSGQDFYAAIWERRNGPAWQARHGMTSADYQQAFDDLNGQGYRLVDVSGYSVAARTAMRLSGLNDLTEGGGYTHTKKIQPAQPINKRPLRRLRNLVGGTIFSTRTKALRPAIHNGFIMPKAKSRPINAQQQPRQ
jgi:hypothetical protein